MPKRKASFYGVRAGHKPGVYDDWEECKRQVIGFPGNNYRSFPTRAEAEDYVGECLKSSQGSTRSTVPVNRSSQENSIVQSSVSTSGNCSRATSFLKANRPKVTEFLRKSSLTCAEGEKDGGEYTKSLPSVVIGVISSQSLHDNGNVGGSSENPAKDDSECLGSSNSSHDNLFKLVEEYGEQFVVFESIADFDTYFEWRCRSKNMKDNLGSRRLLTAANQPKGRPEKEKHIPNKPCKVSEDEEFVFFKDQEELEGYLAPFFRTDTLSDEAGISSPAMPSPQFSFQGICQIEFDGASKGNPGQAGAGALLRCPHGNVILELAEFLGVATNNVAEYRSLILGIKGALSLGIKRIKAQGDSKLVCMQVRGSWKVQNENLMLLYKEVLELLAQLELFSIVHVERRFNSAADALANDAVCLGGLEPTRSVQRPLSKCCL